MAEEPRTQVTAVTGNRSPRVLRLVVFPDGVAQAFDLPRQGDVTIGRSRDCAVRIDHTSVSRRHATIHVGDGLELEDMFSANGVSVGAAALAPGQRVPIDAGTIFQIGDVRGVIAASGSGEPAAMAKVMELVETVAKGEISVLVVGETGAGKEVLARAIHDRSPRAHGPFVATNCAALPEHLLESELFGYEKGAFTGAVTNKPGLFEAAAGGTILLDEIGDMPLPTQAKILRALEAREVTPLGSVRPRKIDVRVIAATHRDLPALVEEKAFREDLLFRIAAITIRVPPLRERVAEIRGIATELLTEECRKSGKPKTTFTPAVVTLFESYAWPGNVRELRNAMERAALLATGDIVGIDDVTLGALSSGPTSRASGTGTERAQTLPADPEAARIFQALEDCGGNQTAAAKKLGITRKALVWQLDKLDVRRPRRG